MQNKNKKKKKKKKTVHRRMSTADIKFRIKENNREVTEIDLIIIAVSGDLVTFESDNSVFLYCLLSLISGTVYPIFRLK